MLSPKPKYKQRIIDVVRMEGSEMECIKDIQNPHTGDGDVATSPPQQSTSTSSPLEKTTKIQSPPPTLEDPSRMEVPSTVVEIAKEVNDGREEESTDDDREDSPTPRSPSPPFLPRVVTSPRQAWQPRCKDEVESDDEAYLKEYESQTYHRFLEITFGGCSRIYSAIHATTDEEVIVKRPIIKNGYESVFSDEIELLEKVQGPGIVEYKDRFYRDNLDFLVMEKMDTDLFRILKEQPKLSEADRKAFIKMALIGIKTVHDQGYIHQDIKPDNFFFSREKGLKLGDFGRATKDDGQQKYTNSYYRNYRPLELLNGDDRIDRKADLWALGCVHQDLIMGEGLWTNTETDLQQAYQVKNTLNSDCLRKTKQFDQLSPKEYSFLSSLMQLNPKQRASVDEALADSWFEADPAPTPNNKLPIKHFARDRGGKSNKEEVVKRSREEDDDESYSSESSKRPYLENQTEEADYIAGIFSPRPRNSLKRKRNDPRPEYDFASEDEDDDEQTKKQAVSPPISRPLENYSRDGDEDDQDFTTGLRNEC